MKNTIETLQTALPAWHFEPYGQAGAIACFPPGQTDYEAWQELSRHAQISSVCGPFYSVTGLNALTMSEANTIAAKIIVDGIQRRQARAIRREIEIKC